MLLYVTIYHCIVRSVTTWFPVLSDSLLIKQHLDLGHQLQLVPRCSAASPLVHIFNPAAAERRAPQGFGDQQQPRLPSLVAAWEGTRSAGDE